MVQLVTSNDIGEGLVIANNLLSTAVDNSTIVIENGVLVTKPRKKITAAEKRARKNKSSFWNRQKATV